MSKRQKKVVLKYVTKEFDMYKRKSDKIKSLFTFWRKDIPMFWALRGINLDIYAGESVGIIGLNGSGKSTLSNIIAGVIPPTTGSVRVRGESSILAIGAGFKPSLTGRENIHMRLLMLGKKESFIQAVTPQIIDFADIGEFIDQPLKSYSSGMKSRLGFGVEVYSNPDVFVIDEALAVGDQTFADKCAIKIKELKDAGKTIIVVSHSVAQLQQLCDRVIWMHYGEMKQIGEPKIVLESYKQFVKTFNEKTDVEKKQYQHDQKQEQQLFELKEYKRESLHKLSEVQHINKQMKQWFEKQSDEKMSTGVKVMLALLLLTILISSIYYVTQMYSYMSF